MGTLCWHFHFRAGIYVDHIRVEAAPVGVDGYSRASMRAICELSRLGGGPKSLDKPHQLLNDEK